MSLFSNRRFPVTRRHWWCVVLVAVAVMLLAWLWRSQTNAPAGPARMADRQRVVTVAEADTADVPILFTALGTVTANRIVTVASRVAGQLQAVYFEEGQYVEKGQRLAQIDPRPYQATLAQYQAALQQDKALLKSARQELARDRKLYQQDSLARQELEAQIATVAEYAGAVKADQARIRTAKLDLDYTRITAPISGYTGLRLIDPGNLVQASDSAGIVTITQTDPIAVVFSLPQADLQAVLPGLRDGETMPVWALGQLDGEVLSQGVLTFISNQIDIETGTIKLKARFDNPEQTLYPNQAVRVRLQTGVIPDAVLIPRRAVQLSDAGSFVWVVQADNRVTKRPVRTGTYQGTKVVIEQGLDAGETVVTQGVDHLDEGTEVRIASALDD